MSTSVPTEIRNKIREKVWAKATELDWSKLSDLDRASWYENWSKDKDIGGVLAHFMDPRKVRVYIKDSMLKLYARRRLTIDIGKVFSASGLVHSDGLIRKSFERPHGRLLVDGKVICWGSSRDWKSVLFSVFERAYRVDRGQPFAAILIEEGKTSNVQLREMIEQAAKRLEIEQISWLE